MSKLPRIQNFLHNTELLEKIIKIRLKEEKNRLDGIGNTLPKDFVLFNKIKNNTRLYDSFEKMQDVYVLHKNDRISIKNMLAIIDNIHNELQLNSSWIKDYYDIETINDSKLLYNNNNIDCSTIDNNKTSKNLHTPKK